MGISMLPLKGQPFVRLNENLQRHHFNTLPTGLKEVEDDLEYSDYKRPFHGSLKTFTDSGYKVVVGPEVDRIHAIIIDPFINLTITESFVF